LQKLSATSRRKASSVDLYYNDPIWKELGIIIDLAELEAIDGHKRTASYRISNQ